jgi:carbohydrate ABC transporter substrate-binding protein, CUT1 family (TC 3.A.1.1.-)
MKTSTRGRILVAVAATGAMGLALAGCSGGPGSTGGGGDDDGGDASNVVTVYGTIADTEAELLEESWAAWEEENDIDIKYEASKEFEAQIAVRAQGGNPPDLAIFPQPGC